MARISNLSDYFGDTKNIVSKEILNGDQFKLTVNVDDIDFDSSAVSFDIDAQLFTATTTQRGSSINFDTLVVNPNTITRSLSENSSIDGKTLGSFDLIIPETLLSGFSSTQIGTISAFDNSLGEITISTGINNLQASFPLNGELIINNTVVTYGTIVFETDPGDSPDQAVLYSIKLGGLSVPLADLNIVADTTQVFLLDDSAQDITVVPLNNTPVVMMKVQWSITDDDGFATKRSIRFLFIMRYQPTIA